MKYTQHFLYTRHRAGRAEIKMEWIKSVNHKPLATQTQKDGRIREWGYIAEVGRYLRIVLLEDGETLHDAFFDRNFQEPSHED